MTVRIEGVAREHLTPKGFEVMPWYTDVLGGELVDSFRGTYERVTVVYDGVHYLTMGYDADQKFSKHVTEDFDEFVEFMKGIE